MKEHDVVALRGTIVHVYPDGSYEVEVAGTTLTVAPQEVAPEPLRLGALVGLLLLTLVAGIALGRSSAGTPLSTINLFTIPVLTLAAILLGRAIARWLGP